MRGPPQLECLSVTVRVELRLQCLQIPQLFERISHASSYLDKQFIWSDGRDKWTLLRDVWENYLAGGPSKQMVHFPFKKSFLGGQLYAILLCTNLDGECVFGTSSQPLCASLPLAGNTFSFLSLRKITCNTGPERNHSAFDYMNCPTQEIFFFFHFQGYPVEGNDRLWSQLREFSCT